MNIKQKIASAAIIGGMAASVLAPASFAAGNNTVIRNNGALSKNTVANVNLKKTTVIQSNTTVANTNIGIASNTGKNSSSFNVGRGDKTITSGRVSNTVNVTVEGSTNENVDDCGCENNTNNAVIRNNGALSKNTVLVLNASKTTTYQSNTTIANTNIGIASNTGGNKSNFNVGGGSSITSGPTTTNVDVTVEGSTNTNE